MSAIAKGYIQYIVIVSELVNIFSLVLNYELAYKRLRKISTSQSRMIVYQRPSS
jgi:hypothetical protein